MKRTRRHFLLLCSLCITLGCSDSDADPTSHPSTTSGVRAPRSCDEPGGLQRLEDSLCPKWSDLVRGRLVRQSIGSAVLWSVRTQDGYGLIAGATHTLGSGWFGAPGEPIAAGFVEPEINGVMRLQLPPQDGSLEQTDVSPLYSLFHLELPAAQNKGSLSEILPRHDVFIGLVDKHRVLLSNDGTMIGIASPERSPGPVSLYDPQGLASSKLDLTQPAPGDLLLLAGYPQDTVSFPLGAISVAHVLSDDEAQQAIKALDAQRDPEGKIPYDPEVEMLLRGSAVAGMSGGGAFDRQGKWVGTLVRASDPLDGAQIIRVVRAQYLISKAQEAYMSLGEEEAKGFAPFLDPILMGK